MFRPVSDTVVTLLAASTPFFDLYVDELSDPTGSSFSFATYDVDSVDNRGSARPL